MRPYIVILAIAAVCLCLAAPVPACPGVGVGFYGASPCEIGPPVAYGVNYGLPAVGFAPGYSTFIPQPRFFVDHVGQVRLANHHFFGGHRNFVQVGNDFVRVNRGNVAVAVNGGANVAVRRGFFGATRVRVR